MLAEISSTIQSYSFAVGGEEDLQEQVWEILSWQVPYSFVREFVISPRDRIDFFIPQPRIGIECKVDGAPASVMRQLLRYAEFEWIDGLILVTMRSSHLKLSSRTDLENATLQVCWIGGNQL